MDELRESSLLFSLESLLETERQRVEREAREAEQRRHDELTRVAELAERRRVANQKEREARERRLQLEQERERLEQERLEAMKRATVERARIEAESHARLVEVEQARKHDLALSRIREQVSTARYRALFGVSAAAFVLTLGASLFVFFGFVRPTHAREQQQLQAIVSATEARATASAKALAAEVRKNQALEARLAQLSAPKPEPKMLQPKPVTPVTPVTPGRPPRGDDDSKRTICTNSGDPLEKCLP